MTLHNDADRLLERIGKATARLKDAEAEAEQEIEGVRAHYAKSIDPLRERLKDLDKEIVTLMKSRQVDLFDGKDTVKLLHGILLYAREMGVTIPRDALAKIEAHDWIEAIKIAKSIDRAVVERWPDERLVMIGATHKEKVTYSYEVIYQKSEDTYREPSGRTRSQRSEVGAR